MMTKNPCSKDCPSRKFGCHANCIPYKQFKIVTKIRSVNNLSSKALTSDKAVSDKRRKLNQKLRGR